MRITAYFIDPNFIKHVFNVNGKEYVIEPYPTDANICQITCKHTGKVQTATKKYDYCIFDIDEDGKDIEMYL